MQSTALFLDYVNKTSSRQGASAVDFEESQEKVLRYILATARKTEFGKAHRFKDVLRSNDVVKAYAQETPVHGYDEMLPWWEQVYSGKKSITWPGFPDHLSLSSGSALGPSKFIPITKDILKHVQRACLQQLDGLAALDNENNLEKGQILLLGGSTKMDSSGFQRGLSIESISKGSFPNWFKPFYKPYTQLSHVSDWQHHLDLMVEEAPHWNISAVVGDPLWVNTLLKKACDFAMVDDIHELWPNLRFIITGGAPLQPYKERMQSLLGKKVGFLEAYFASEGFLGYQTNPDLEGIKLLSDAGTYFELMPLSGAEFDEFGKPLNPTILPWREAVEGEKYAMVLSTCGGAWRYLLDDVILLENKRQAMIKIAGRLHHFVQERSVDDLAPESLPVIYHYYN